VRYERSTADTSTIVIISVSQHDHHDPRSFKYTLTGLVPHAVSSHQLPRDLGGHHRGPVHRVRFYTTTDLKTSVVSRKIRVFHVDIAELVLQTEGEGGVGRSTYVVLAVYFRQAYRKNLKQ
jgi:hypothetical protein